MTVEHPQVIKARLSMIATDAMDCIADLQCQVSDLRTERDELAEQVDSLRQQLGVEIRAKDQWEQNAEYAQAERDEVEKVLGRLQEDLGSGAIVETPHVPRTVTADELREGQLICIHRWHVWGVRAIGEFQGVEGDVVTIKTGGSGTFTESVKFHTIVLLADAPVKDVYASTGHVKDRADSLHVTAEDIRNSEPGSTWEEDCGHRRVYEWTGTGLRGHAPDGSLRDQRPVDHVLFMISPEHALTRSTAVPRGTYPKRLTVSDLDAAEVGSVLKSPEGYSVRKDRSGWGWDRLGAEELLAISAIDWSTATLTPPEKPELPTEAGSIIQVTETDKGPIAPSFAILRGSVWDPMPGFPDFPDGDVFKHPDQITGWKPARIVVEGEE